ncbi:DNA repair ATPase [Psychromonas sp. Urea-02u-13]|uniref:DNA repair ATPase n=1 Tax=Psychromonas sp. Urea-02u-13 TaxID=2058326 RepID=UPI000C330BB0|nr:DNA repair ATPase [Psychromonas sp. Urea-02u-13]PKG39595.1 DNA repair ATPase [Psychromonas sp. Urea-02u-13]
MLFPIILTLVGLLFFVMVGYNIVQQYKQKIEAEKRIAISKQRAVISEVDELLLNATRMPFSKSLLLILQNRIRNALLLMLKSSPNNNAVRDHLKNTDAQIQQVRANYTPPDESVFRTPENDKEALALLQVTKKIRAVLRSEHAKGKINTQIFVAEDHRLEIMQLKINLENGIKRIMDAKNVKQFGSANQMINKLVKILSSIPDKDSYLDKKQAQLLSVKAEIKTYLVEHNDQELAAIKAKDVEKQNDLDVLFQDKKKW